MIFDTSTLIAALVAYLATLFLLTWLAEKRWMPTSMVMHPLVAVLSLGVYCSAWAYYGAPGLAATFGYGYLVYYVGISAAFVLYPVMLRPFLRVTKSYQLTSLADVFAFRYRSRWVGAVTTLLMLIVMLPLLMVQIQAIAKATQILSPTTPTPILALIFSVVVALFTIRFGASQKAQDDKQQSLFFALAMDAIFKLAILLVLGAVAVFTVFHSFSGLSEWLMGHPSVLTASTQTMAVPSWSILMVLFFLAPLTMPHMFHLLFREGQNGKSLRLVSWGFPLFLVMMSLPVLPILWANVALGSSIPPAFSVLGLGIALDASRLTLLAYMGGISASTGLTVLATLALASMTLNHLAMPFHQPKKNDDIYIWLLWIRRFLIVCIIASAYVMHLFWGESFSMTTLGLASFVGTIHFIPGVIGTLYWPTANKRGFLIGLIAGFVTWFLTTNYPLFSGAFMGVTDPSYVWAFGEHNWALAAFASITINIAFFITFSWLTPNSEDEINAANACMQNSLVRSTRRELSVENVPNMVTSLSLALGDISAQREVKRALADLNYSDNELRPNSLSRLRDQIESNLSGLMGPGVAQSVVKRYLPFVDTVDGVNHDINVIEDQLESYQNRLTGLAAELNHLRRYHRETLENLPMGVCSIGLNGKIIMWNQAMTDITGLSASDCIGEGLNALPLEWQRLLSEFLAGTDSHLYRHQVIEGRNNRWLNLHKAALPSQAAGWVEGNVIMLEDQSELQNLEDELVHADRLASIGGLAAGVAHEIGNPVTGIDCLAQNLMYEENSDDIKEIGQQIRSQTLRVTKIVQSLVNFAHGSKTAHQEHYDHDIHDVINEAIGLLELSRQSQDVNFINAVPVGVSVPCDPQRLAQVFINLLSNARDASQPGQDVIIGLYGPLSSHRVKIEIRDQGTGIPPDVLERVLEPFFTTKGVGKGTGLGLWLAYSIIEEHFGQINFESPPSGLKESGTRVIITLPKTQQSLVSKDSL